MFNPWWVLTQKYEYNGVNNNNNNDLLVSQIGGQAKAIPRSHRTPPSIPLSQQSKNHAGFSSKTITRLVSLSKPI